MKAAEFSYEFVYNHISLKHPSASEMYAKSIGNAKNI